ncbi:hypothetical protein Glove_309g21 [Diversispora epigaea]|uniref:Uncharacterized protein n=1 Tax=Diversispora epigaea TaxID=1348612 RepID=A0A397HY82_9GLOM|nr:hypothetical protein Glove_309g21 [Diversispora epigaea]
MLRRETKRHNEKEQSQLGFGSTIYITSGNIYHSATRLWNYFSNYIITEERKKSVKVNGTDEILGGYNPIPI